MIEYIALALGLKLTFSMGAEMVSKPEPVTLTEALACTPFKIMVEEKRVKAECAAVIQEQELLMGPRCGSYDGTVWHTWPAQILPNGTIVCADMSVVDSLE